MPRPDAMRMLFARIEIDAQTGCWHWTGNLNPAGYGRVNWCGKIVKAHRLMYETIIGPIAEGLTIDHLCYVRDCVNPDHLEAVTMAENLRRRSERGRHSALADPRIVAVLSRYRKEDPGRAPGPGEVREEAYAPQQVRVPGSV